MLKIITVSFFGTQEDTMSDYNRNNNNNSFDPSWLFIIIAFAVFWPVGVGLLIYKLSQSD